MKTLEQIQKEVANECAEGHFEVLLEAEIMAGDYQQAKRLLNEVTSRYINQYIENTSKKMSQKESKSLMINQIYDKYHSNPYVDIFKHYDGIKKAMHEYGEYCANHNNVTDENK